MLPASGSGPQTIPSSAQVANFSAGNPPRMWFNRFPLKSRHASRSQKRLWGAALFLGAEAFEEVSFEDPGCEQRNYNSGGEVVIAGSGAIAGSDAIAAVG